MYVLSIDNKLEKKFNTFIQLIQIHKITISCYQ